MPESTLATLTELLAECRLDHLCVSGQTLRSLRATAADGRPALLEALRGAGVGKAPQRSTIANALSKAERAGRLQPSPDEEPGEAPDPDGPLSAHGIRDGGWEDGRLAELLSAVLPGLHTSAPSMPGEEKGAQARSKCFVPRPDARVRLFCLYGVADVAMSLEPWIRSAPAWLEVRLCDLPGHGFRSDEPLPSCALPVEAGLDEEDLAGEREGLVGRLADEILAAAGEAPFALYGFSFGALLLYGVAVEAARRGATNLLCLCVAGRGAAHAATLSRATADMIVRSDAEGMLRFQGPAAAAIPKPMRERSSTLFRCGVLLGAAPAGGGSLSSPLPDPPGEGADALGQADAAVGFHADTPHAAGAPLVACPLVSVGSDADTVWPDAMVRRWKEVAALPSAEERVGGRRRHVHLTVAGEQHMKLMSHKQTMDIVFREVGVAARAMLPTTRHQ